jgi:hypothetical protein
MPLNIIKYKNYVKKNMKEEYTGTNNCSSSCNNKCNLSNRRYKSNVRTPIKGYRNTLNCNKNDNKFCYTYQEVFRDTYSNAKTITCPANSTSGNYSRTNKPLIKSGMMPNKNGTAKAENMNDRYAYSYRERMNNLKKTTYNRNLPKNSTGTNSTCYDGTSSGENCKNVVQKYNNKEYFQQGAVSSSTRLERLKLKALSKKCVNGDKTECKYDRGTFLNRIVGPKDIYKTKNECSVNPKLFSNALYKVRGATHHKC